MELWAVVFVLTFGSLLGSFIGVMKKPGDAVIFHLLSFSAGIMLAISLFKLLPASIGYSSIPLSIIGIVFGCAIMFFSDRALHYMHPSTKGHEEGNKCKAENKNGHLHKTAIFLLFGIFIHNFPEGLAIALGSISSTKLTLTLAIAIAIHDIPEGICTSAPYYYATGKRLKAFLLSASVIIPTLAGFFLGSLVFKSIPLHFVGAMLGSVAGIMIYISADELIPCSCSKLTSHHTIFSFMAGVITVVLLDLL